MTDDVSEPRTPDRVRVMTARRTKGLCDWCSGLLVQGQRITLRPGHDWEHAECARKQLDGYWSDAYTQVSPAEAEHRRAAEQQRALAMLRSQGKRIA